MIEGTQTRFHAYIERSMAIKRAVLFDHKISRQIEFLAEACLASLRAGGKVIFAGNGGSFADAQHLSAEFISRFMFDRAPLASVVLGANNATLSAVANDYGYDQAFSRELMGIGKVEDIFIPISTSGNSPNILAAAEVAKNLGIFTMGLTGQCGGSLKSVCECLNVPSLEVAHIQECHTMLGHILCLLVEEGFFLREPINE